MRMLAALDEIDLPGDETRIRDGRFRFLGNRESPVRTRGCFFRGAKTPCWSGVQTRR